MKRIITFCILFITVGIFLTACGTSYSITKRQHSKGYHVSSNKKYTAPDKKLASPITSEKVEENNEVAIIQLAEEAVKGTENIKAFEKSSSDALEINTSSSDVKEAKSSKTTSKVVVNSTSTSNTTVDSPNKVTERSNLTPLSVLKSANNNMKSTVNAMQRRSSDQGLSLLWIVIIVLIILWAFGYIGGIGSSGLIHLLLVVALILLILWLLRII